MHFIFNFRAGRHRKLIQSLGQDRLKIKMKNTALVLAGLCTAHTGAMMAFEGLPFEDALWLTMTTATTVGYGDLSAKTSFGRGSTMILMYAGAITALAQLASSYMDYRQTKLDAILNGKWKYNMNSHIVIFNCPDRNPMGYFTKLVTEFRKSALPVARKDLAVVSDHITPEMIQDFGKLGVAPYKYTPTSNDAFKKSSVENASHIVILAKDECDPETDSITFDLISRAREANPNAIIIAEAVSELNGVRFERAGANHVIRPIRAYPEMLVNSILAPGSEKIMVELFNNDGEEIIRYDVPVNGLWGEIQCRCIMEDIGTPLGFIDNSGKVVMAATVSPKTVIDAQALFVAVRGENLLTNLVVANKLALTPTAGQRWVIG